jgi:hypothetical protein
MSIKTFLPMGGKPPDIVGRGSQATTNQGPTIISFSPFQQFSEEFEASNLFPEFYSFLTDYCHFFYANTCQQLCPSNAMYYHPSASDFYY